MPPAPPDPGQSTPTVGAVPARRRPLQARFGRGTVSQQTSPTERYHLLSDADADELSGIREVVRPGLWRWLLSALGFSTSRRVP